MLLIYDTRKRNSQSMVHFRKSQILKSVIIQFLQLAQQRRVIPKLIYLFRQALQLRQSPRPLSGAMRPSLGALPPESGRGDWRSCEACLNYKLWYYPDTHAQESCSKKLVQETGASFLRQKVDASSRN